MNSADRMAAALAACCLLYWHSTTRAAVLIDSFDTPQVASVDLGDRNTADGPGIIGGERDFVTFVLLSADGVVANQLHIASPRGGGGDIFYDGNDNDASSGSFGGMGAIDLTQGGANDRLRFVFTDASNIPATMTIDVKNFGVGAGLQINLPKSPGIVDVPFASFAAPAVFQNVGYINLHFEIHGVGTYAIDTIAATIPEPSALSLAAFAAAGIVIGYRSNRRTRGDWSSALSG
jgi:hypothetical protein